MSKRKWDSRPTLVPARDIDELLAAAGPGPDPDMWTRDAAECDELLHDVRSTETPVTS